MSKKQTNIICDRKYIEWYKIGSIQPVLDVPKEKTVIFDTETTGLKSLKGDEILQISAVDGNGNVLFNDYIKPLNHTSWKEAERVNHISWDMVKDKQTLPERIPDLNQIFENAELIVGYNVEFDISFLRASFINVNPNALLFDVMKEYAPCYGTFNEHKQDFKWVKLTQCARHYGYKFEAHDSLEDTRATAHCFYSMLKEEKVNAKTMMAYLEVIEKYGANKEEHEEATTQRAVESLERQEKSREAFKKHLEHEELRAQGIDPYADDTQTAIAQEEAQKEAEYQTGEILEHDSAPESKSKFGCLLTVLLWVVLFPYPIWKLFNKLKVNKAIQIIILVPIVVLWIFYIWFWSIFFSVLFG